MPKTARVAIIPGDGIGPEVMTQARRVVEAACGSADRSWLSLIDWDLGAERYLSEGLTITEDELHSLGNDHDAILLGALGDPRVPGNEHASDILLGLRFRLDLYVNYRPAVLLDAGLSPLRRASVPTRIEIFRENTEGAYSGLGGSLKMGTSDEIAVEEDVNTRKGVERIIRAAFAHARAHRRRRVTLADKANAQRHVGALYRRVFETVAREYGEIEAEAVFVDALAMDLVRRPDRYQVIVASNLFGDILSDLAAEVTGGLGMAPSANLHPGRHALFEPVHGSAPDIAGQGIANPIGAIRCVALLLEYLGHPAEAAKVERAAAQSVLEGVRTRDLGGSATTTEVGAWIAERVRAEA